MRAFTLIEILLVIVILSILVGLAVPISLSFYKSQQLNTHTRGIIQTLRRAQLKSTSIENDSSFGVYLTNDNYTLFKGSSFVDREAQYDEVFDLPQIITLSGIQEVVFSKVEGSASIIGNIILNSNSDSQTININEIGRINLE